MGLDERIKIPVTELSDRLLRELKDRFPWCNKSQIASHALELGLIEMGSRPYVASGAPVVEWRKTG